MSDSFGVHAPEDRDRLERCLETLEAAWQAGDETSHAHVLLEADLSHEILRRLHRELLWLGGLATDCPDSALLEKELGHPLPVFRERMRTIGETFERMSALKNELVESSLGLVVAQVAQFEHLGLPVADLVQEGNGGLLRAAERFDPCRGVVFATYALWWIRHGVIRAVQNHGRTVRLPTHQHDAVRDFRRRQQALEQELGRAATREEIAVALGIEPYELDELRRLQASPVSLDAELPGEEAGVTTSWLDVLCDPAALHAIDAIERADLLSRVLAEIAMLPPRERRILLLRYGLAGGATLSLREIGCELDLSGERVRQLEVTALDRLRRRLGGEASGA